ncbi:histidine phosphatase family protein [Flaviaesturariibacter flavus]|uniref:Histidine phosphatase family protein n=1 Tax=Flaviaesturariibacter flavus TaxID=2502780 RepID=A0A4R1BIC8_9BACT|nr:histidine phosphatase family protein [Flaviaesturariibacter flavus]TCJ17036.1 histidine phosphatase family protein [Flaviaesturariibacter flavus]
MKILLLVRHAKSSWDDITMKDFDRPLNERGKKDAPEMAERVKEKVKVEHFVTSPAKRARRTARFFAEAFGFEKDDIVVVDHLYEPTVQAFADAVAALPADKNVVALFAHNPGITEYVNTLTNVRIDDMPTCAVFAVGMEGKTWAEFATAEKKFLFFDYPKNPVG